MNSKGKEAIVNFKRFATTATLAATCLIAACGQEQGPPENDADTPQLAQQTTVTDELRARREGMKGQAPSKVIAQIDTFVADLRASGIAASARGVGDTLPMFSLPDAAGNLVNSGELLAQGPLVLTYYRGYW